MAYTTLHNVDENKLPNYYTHPISVQQTEKHPCRSEKAKHHGVGKDT